MESTEEKQSLFEPPVFAIDPVRTSPRNYILLLIVATVSGLSLYASNTTFLNNTFFYEVLHLKTTTQIEDVCVFQRVDVFDPEIMEYYKNSPVCKRENETITVLQQGMLKCIKPLEYDCWGRCHTFKNGNATFEGDWYHADQNYTFPCDIVGARCSPKQLEIASANYFFMHTQVVEVSPTAAKETSREKQYDVYFIVVDSQSHTQMFRNLNKTNNFLLNEMEALDFPYVNRIGDGSNPNGFAWLYGKMTERVDRTLYSMTSLEPAPEWKDYCKRNMDNETTIISEFGEYGYTTAHVADWYRTVDYGCVGTDDMISDHSYTPYAMYYEYNKDMIKYMSKQQCIHRHQHALGQFIDSYKDKPKMAFVWLSHVGHNTERGSLDVDQQLADLFKNHQEKFDNSFLFLAGDHGLRHTSAINTKVGALDINNPALLITVPKELRRKSEFMATLKENAAQLQTHYDTRATLLDILKFQPPANYNDRKLMNIEGELGNSYLRQQPKPRSCRTSSIPPSYCICEKQMNEDFLKTNPEEAKLIGRQTIDLINLNLSNTNGTELCRKWVFKETTKLVQFSKTPTFQFEGLFAATNDRNLQAVFKIFLSGREKSSLEIYSLARVDSYRHAADCVIRSLRTICDCY